MIIAGQPIALSQPINNCVVPIGLPEGPVFIFITDDMQPLASNIAIQNVGQIKAGPAIVFLDQHTDTLGALVRNTGDCAPKQEDSNGSNSDLKVLGTTNVSVTLSIPCMPRSDDLIGPYKLIVSCTTGGARGLDARDRVTYDYRYFCNFLFISSRFAGDI
jgi:hypothetical protein